ncbi:hypothetical protein [Modestobacter altitudinis]|uniref:hypothetical protein n=1 Tax=Modestobacter altitudinis TaxID=2213158 RepID=UPI00110CCB80|nr:hypothetical protein [Modestobacter altitudinis]
MFAQVITGRTSDADGVRAALDRWVEELAPGAVGWLGSTVGTTDDGTFIAIARFTSAEAAGRNGQRPEQDRWWQETSRLFDGEVGFRDSEDVTVDLQGDPDRAGFVQVMQGRMTDLERAKEVMAQIPADLMASFRPDVLGSVMVGHPDGAWTQVLYFTSEAEAREGERKEPPREFQVAMEDMGKLSVGETTFLDLRSPLLRSAS